jgi:hypothetical protein
MPMLLTYALLVFDFKIAPESADTESTGRPRTIVTVSVREAEQPVCPAMSTKRSKPHGP